MNTPSILLVTDRDGVRGFVDASAEGYSSAAPQTLIQLSDGGLVRVPTSLLTQLDDTNYFLSCSISDLLPPADLMPPADAVVRREVVATVPVMQLLRRVRQPPSPARARHPQARRTTATAPARPGLRPPRRPRRILAHALAQTPTQPRSSGYIYCLN